MKVTVVVGGKISCFSAGPAAAKKRLFREADNLIS
jgi:hypothetical protein